MKRCDGASSASAWEVLQVAAEHELGFLRGMAENLEHYVYALADPRTRKIFYVGKRKGDRVYQHAAAALKLAGESAEESKLGTIQAIQQAGLSPVVHILRHRMTDEVAREVEAAVIDAMRLVGVDVELKNKVRGARSADHGWRPLSQLRDEYGARQVEITHRGVLLRISRTYHHRIDPEALYEATRGWWKMDPKRRPDYAFAVSGGIIRAVYQIDHGGWTCDAATGDGQFTGQIEPVLTAYYDWVDVSDHFPPGSQTPIRYVNCGRRLAERRRVRPSTLPRSSQLQVMTSRS